MHNSTVSKGILYKCRHLWNNSLEKSLDNQKQKIMSKRAIIIPSILKMFSFIICLFIEKQVWYIAHPVKNND